jgi:hypothetical protein
MTVLVSVLGLVAAISCVSCGLVLRRCVKDFIELDVSYHRSLSLLADLYDHCEHCCGSDVVWNGWCGDHDPDLRTQVKEFLAEEGLG